MVDEFPMNIITLTVIISDKCEKFSIVDSMTDEKVFLFEYPANYFGAWNSLNCSTATVSGGFDIVKR